MNQISVQRALFASTSNGAIQGYQLAAKSDGIDSATAQELCRWSPTRMASADPRQWSLNHYRIGSHTHAVTRTVLGGPEYSGRGNAEVVTLILLLDGDQMSGYGHSPIAVARTALALGELRLPADKAARRLEPVSLPHRMLVPSEWDEDRMTPEKAMTADRIAARLESGERLAVIGSKDPLALADQILHRLRAETRRQLSFTTGLPVSTHRPFRLHFLQSADQATHRKLQSLQIRLVDLTAG